LTLLTQKYLERLQQLEQAQVFFISSKIIYAAAILLKMKSQLLHENILSIDEILFDKKKKVNASELIDSNSMIDFANEDYEILPRTPMPRARKITLQELMGALDKAINTEHRRIKKELSLKRINYDMGFVLPKKTIDIRAKIKELYQKIKNFFTGRKSNEFLTFTELAGIDKTERVACFLPLLHLDSQEKIFLEQEKPFYEINVWLKGLEPKKELPEELEKIRDNENVTETEKKIIEKEKLEVSE